MTTQIQIPQINLRQYQRDFWVAMEKGARRAALVWPRRAGKDTVSLAWTAFDALQHVGQYWHLFPEQTQARKAIWHGVNRDGDRIIDVAFPPKIRRATNESEMRIEFVNGSQWMLGGSDRFDALVGSNPRGVVFSEFAIANPRAYDFVRPILAENGGWALFPYTPRGRNHGYELFEKLSQDAGSFAQLLTCDDTGHMSEDALRLERSEMSSELFEQEYYASWDFGSEGSFYSKQMNTAQREGRITSVPHDPSLLTHVSWDIGLRDSTALWFFQVGGGGQIRWIDYEEAHGEQLDYYVKLIRSKDYNYGNDLFLPHDAGHERLGAESIENQLRDLGFGVRVLKVERSVLPGIESCRVGIAKSVFDEAKTKQGRACLNAYQREYDDKRQVFKPTPLHNWASDGADSFRYAVRAINAGHCSNVGWGQPDYSTLNRAAI